jgi:hypothetical protein
MSRRSGIRFADKDMRQHENLQRFPVTSAVVAVIGSLDQAGRPAIVSYVCHESSPLLERNFRQGPTAAPMFVSDVELVPSATPVLRGASSAETDSEDRSILLSKRFSQGGSLKVVVARAPRDLITMGCRPHDAGMPRHIAASVLFTLRGRAAGHVSAK